MMRIFEARSRAAARLAGLVLAAGAALAAVPAAHAAAGAGAITLRAGGTSATTTLTLRDAGLDPGGRRRFAYTLRVARGVCHASLAGVAHLAAQADAAGGDAASLRNGAGVNTRRFHDAAEGRDVTLTIDVGSARPQYAGVQIGRAPAGCVDWQRLDGDFYAR
ncbi:hypothetical protein EFP18_08080 [Burkholderia glumae]|uniref:hypothetical protein n=1 Tax=Burkholderia glumae TaxID=337 RepID=UPI000F5F1E39|nr:hypothetical protein [Burkholderia glumae]MCQ0032912.1 hypothetical protein [Burkholderia glumae]MCQ0037530.1 hypothetical protein [Burkholderia glumae]QJP70385.1 hypothetical protein HJC54_08940 [Burkholderia glumae]QJW80647.1 hypothetical protein GAS18_17995 [Burkholderia glumae]RQZ68443.1 hypothetical protein DF052_23225 [Burkholderia glumae]